MGWQSVEQRREFYRKLYAERVQIIHKHLGGKCCQCGAVEGLKIVDRPGKKTRMNLSKCLSFSLERLFKMAKGAKLYCPECFKAMRREKRPWRHGTWWSSYKKKCQCDECGEYRANYALQRREDRRDKRLAAQSA